eukprot:GEMP01044421.1.p1 GENE.GEMP01044421.1~~GEMP01044421.1.p1  ORF type:complete len:426 (+),score=119.58 GEMP01044421.1:67-1344(+)
MQTGRVAKATTAPDRRTGDGARAGGKMATALGNMALGKRKTLQGRAKSPPEKGYAQTGDKARSKKRKGPKPGAQKETPPMPSFKELRIMELPPVHSGMSLLHLAAGKQCAVEEATRYLYEDVNQRGWHLSDTPLHWSCRQPTHASLTSLLLAYGADPTMANLHGATPLHFAASQGGGVQVASILKSRSELPEQLDVDARNAAGWTALHLAAMSNLEAASVQLLLERKANPNTVNWYVGEETPLHVACRSRHDCVEALLDAGADATAVTVSGNTPLHLLAANYSPVPQTATQTYSSATTYSTIPVDIEGDATAIKSAHEPCDALPAIDAVAQPIAKPYDELPAISDKGSTIVARPIPEAERTHVALIRHLLEAKASAHARNNANKRPVDVERGEYSKLLLGAMLVELPDRWSTTFRLDTAKPLYKT